MLAQISHLDVGFSHLPRFLGQQHLAAVPGGRNPSCLVDVGSDIAFVDEMRSAGVQAHSNANCPLGQRVLGLLRRL